MQKRTAVYREKQSFRSRRRRPESIVADVLSKGRFDVEDRFVLFPPVRKGERTELARLQVAVMSEAIDDARERTRSRRRVALSVLPAIAEPAWRRN